MHGVASHGSTSRSRIRIRRSAQGTDRSIRVQYRSRATGRGIGLNIIPLVDITFLLMIFFVIAGSLVTWEGVLRSTMLSIGGGSRAGESVPLPYTPIVIRLSRGADAESECRIQIEDSPKTARTFGELSAALVELRENAGFSAETPVIFAVDNDVRWDHAVNGWNAALRAGFTKLAYADEKK